MSIQFLPVGGQVLPDFFSKAVTNQSENLVVCFSLSGPIASSIGLNVRELIVQAQPTSSLELHQFLQDLLHQVREMNLQLEFAAVFQLEEKVVCAVYSGHIWLRRAEKVASLLSSRDELLLIEGNTKPEHIFVLSTMCSEALSQQVQEVAQKYNSLEDISQGVQECISSMSSATPEDAKCVMAVMQSSEKNQGRMMPSLSSVTKKKAQAPQFLKFFLIIPHALLAGVQAFYYFQRSLFSKDVYVRKKNTKKLLKVLVPAVLIIILTVAGGVFWHQKKVNEQSEIQKVMQPIDAELTEIRQQVTSQPIQARDRTEQLISNVQTIAQQYQNNKGVSLALKKELTQLQDFYTSISGKEEFPELPTFYDLRFAEANFLANQLDLNNDTLLFLDSGQKKVLALDTKLKQVTPLPIGDVSEIKDASLGNTTLILLGSGLHKFTLGSNAPAVQLKGSDDANGNADSVVLFGQNVYVLNKEKKNIYRYALKEGDQVTDPVAWLQGGQSFDFGTANSMAIDGDVWVTTQDGQVKKFSAGKEQQFNITGLKEPFSTPIQVYTKDDQQHLYILEPQKERIVILNKNGEFLREIKSSSLASTTNIVAQEKSGKAFALSGQLIFEINL
jgi:hypothetical protein